MRQSLSERYVSNAGVGPLLWVGLFVTAVVAACALIDPSTTRFLAHQVEAGYPSYPSDRVDAAVRTYVVILVTIGVLGLVGWVATLLLVRTGRRRIAAWIGAFLCAAGILIALIGLVTPDTSGAIGLAPVFGWSLLAPCVLGAIAVVAMFRRRT